MPTLNIVKEQITILVVFWNRALKTRQEMKICTNINAWIKDDKLQELPPNRKRQHTVWTRNGIRIKSLLDVLKVENHLKDATNRANGLSICVWIKAMATPLGGSSKSWNWILLLQRLLRLLHLMFDQTSSTLNLIHKETKLKHSNWSEKFVFDGFRNSSQWRNIGVKANTSHLNRRGATLNKKCCF